jgi:hypothetical protein
MCLSPLAERIYQTLVQQRRAPNPLISYTDLVRALGPLPPPDANLKANDKRLFEALEEIHHACRSNRPTLPALTSIVVQRQEDGSLGMPGGGYFAVVFPRVWEETKRLRMWQGEVRRVVAFSYPEKPTCGPPPLPVQPQPVSRWLREPTVIAALIGLAGTLLAAIIPVWISTRRGEPSQPPPAARPVVTIVPQGDEPSQRPQANPIEEKNVPKLLTLDEILDILGRHHQRATFGAVAGILRRDPQSLFRGYTRTPKTAWIVSKTTGLPTGTKESDYPEGLRQNARVIETSDDLLSWLREHH